MDQVDCDENGNRNNRNDDRPTPRDPRNTNNNEPIPMPIPQRNTDPNSPQDVRQRNTRQERERITNRNNIPVEDIHRGFEQLRNSTQIYNNPRIQVEKEKEKKKKKGNSLWNIIILLLISILAVLFVRKF